MTVFRLGYVAMSVHLQNASPSQTMTYRQFSSIKDEEAAIKKLERIAISNLQNCLRLLKHNAINDIYFFRLSSKLIPLVNHPDLPNWDYILPLKPLLFQLGEFVSKHNMRIDFHPDHFVVLNNEDKDILKTSLKTLQMHERLLRGMKVNTEHRCVLHVGGVYNDKEQALEQFISNWGLIPLKWQKMIMLENDDTNFTLNEVLYLCEKLSIPCVFDLHHHIVHNEKDSWEEYWERIVQTWSHSSLPIKMHISSPRTNEKDRAHADYINSEQFLEFLTRVDGTVPQIDCMIEAKKKDDALFELVKDLKKKENIVFIDEASFRFIK
ncbi:UV DNA damage repair endonuclease UvsE [Niallia nealsonii]|uniref:UV DNA damage repair endonuclease UvsE n=1 Tax=Niallia nealsonii TaxID=115979 RepID=A0A2N0Z2E6_9BACI|nr:UV DNA damage repair endonuclease UvsE [Niallia nealsonii]PKG23681.1 UV DNA damage repair endonuclease UvsE [Niallia nealsonii]